MRNEFEAWAPASLDCTIGKDGKYYSGVTQVCFDAWQAALAHREPKVSQPVAYVRPDDDYSGEPCSVCFDRNCNGECMGE